ncbi:MAG: hypothetical protein AB7G13_21870 [Lautropia sp.]
MTSANGFGSTSSASRSVEIIGVVQQLDHRKRQPVAAAEQREAVAVRPPAAAVVGEDRQARDRPAVAVEQPVAISEHPAEEITCAAGLDLDVDVDQLRAAATAVHLYQLVGVAVAGSCLAPDAAQLLVEEPVGTLPVDGAMRGGEKECLGSSYPACSSASRHARN